MSTTSDDSRGALHRCSTNSTSTPVLPPFSSLALIVDRVSRVLDLGNPVSCWSRQAAYGLQPSSCFSLPIAPEPVLRGVAEARNEDKVPQTMVGTVLTLSLLFEQVVGALASGKDGETLQQLVARYRGVANANLVSIPWQAAMDGQGLDAQVLMRADQLIHGGMDLAEKVVSAEVFVPQSAPLYNEIRFDHSV